MQSLLIAVLTLILTSPVMTCGKSDSIESCLPKDVQLKAIISENHPENSSQAKTKPKNVEQRLRELGARCKEGKLVDKTGKEIRFVHLIGCWGNPPEDYQEQLDHQRLELERLHQKYTVIEISCAQTDLRDIH